MNQRWNAVYTIKSDRTHRARVMKIILPASENKTVAIAMAKKRIAAKNGEFYAIFRHRNNAIYSACRRVTAIKKGIIIID